MILVTECLGVLAGMLPLVTGYYQENLFPIAIGCFGIGILWLWSEWSGWVWVAQVGLFVFITAAGAGVLIGLSPFLMALSVLGSLLAWDLNDFSHRLRNAAPGDMQQRLEKNHLRRLGWLEAIGLFLTLAALFIHLQISFGWMVLLALAAILGMVQMVRRFRS